MYGRVNLLLFKDQTFPAELLECAIQENIMFRLLTSKACNDFSKMSDKRLINYLNFLMNSINRL